MLAVTASGRRGGEMKVFQNHKELFYRQLPPVHIVTAARLVAAFDYA